MKNSSSNGIKNLNIICSVVLVLVASTISKAQLNPLSGIYFDNQYLINPAMAGIEKGLNLNIGYRQPWSEFEGAPKTQSLTAELGTSKKIGLGLAIYNDEAGLLKRTRVMGTYSYHLPLNNENNKLRFGISLGFMDDRVMNENLKGDDSDISVSKFNQRDTYIDGDFGAAYTTEKLTVQFSIPNLKSFLHKEDINSPADFSTFYTTASYKFYFPAAANGFGLEPKLALRGIHGFDNILDIGTNITIANNAARFMLIYHSSQSTTFGMGVSVKSLGNISANYTTATSALNAYMNGNFEIGIKVNVLKEKKSLRN